MSWTVASQIWCGLRQREGGCHKTVLEARQRNLRLMRKSSFFGVTLFESPLLEGSQLGLGLSFRMHCVLTGKAVVIWIEWGCLCLCIISTLQVLSSPPKCLLSNSWPKTQVQKRMKWDPYVSPLQKPSTVPNWQVTWWSRALGAPVEDWAWVPRTHMEVHNHLNLQF